MKASESIRLLVDKASRDLTYKAPEIRYSYLLNVLGKALELIEAQEREQEWVPFAESEPDEDDARTLIMSDSQGMVLCSPRHCKRIFEEHELVTLRKFTHWRFVTPPETT